MEDNKPSSLYEFQRTKCLMTQTVYKQAYGVESNSEACNVLVYDDFACIDQYADGLYGTNFNNMSITNRDLEVVETYLWDNYVKWEYQISEDASITDLHERAKLILERLDLDCSLDEVDLKRCNENTKGEIQYLLNQFDKHEENFNAKKEPEITYVAVMDYRTAEVKTYRLADVKDGDEIEEWLKRQGTFHDDCHFMSSPKPIEIEHL